MVNLLPVPVLVSNGGFGCTISVHLSDPSIHPFSNSAKALEGQAALKYTELYWQSILVLSLEYSLQYCMGRRATLGKRCIKEEPVIEEYYDMYSEAEKHSTEILEETDPSQVALQQQSQQQRCFHVSENAHVVANWGRSEIEGSKILKAVSGGEDEDEDYDKDQYNEAVNSFYNGLVNKINR